MTAWREFCPAGYAALIDGVRGLGYEVRDFASADPGARHVVLRHDVDFCLDAAVRMAEQERALGVSSVFFVLLRTEFYNALSSAGLSALRAISGLGHEIGLHFDAALYPHDGVLTGIRQEADWLGSALGAPIRTMSFHRPADGGVGGENELAGLINAYGRRFTRDMVYRSDSRGTWRSGHPLESPEVRAGRALQLLVHPFWWTEPAMSPEDRLRAFLARRARDLDEELARHCLVHKPQRS